jgi:hypothetical protein
MLDFQALEKRVQIRSLLMKRIAYVCFGGLPLAARVKCKDMKSPGRKIGNLQLKQHDPGRVPRGFRRKTAAYFTYALK